MSDTYNPLEKFSSFFFPGDPNDPRANSNLRQRIALAMMARQRKAPQNIGEGLYAVGEAIGDRRMMSRELEQDAADRESATKGTEKVLSGTSDAAPLIAPAASPVTQAALTPPIVAADAGTSAPPSVTPVTRSMTAGTPSPLPPDTAGAMPPPPMAIPPGTVPSITAQPPPGALPTPPGGSVDPRARAALILAARQRGAAVPSNPTEAGGALPAQIPSPTPTGGPSPTPMSRGLGGDSEFSSQNRPIPAAPPDTRTQIQRIPTKDQADFGYVPPERVDVAPPAQAQIHPDSLEARAMRAKRTSGNEYFRANMDEIIARESAKRGYQDKINKDIFDARLKEQQDLRKLREEGLMSEAQRRATGTKTIEETKKTVEETAELANKNRLRAQFANLPPEVVLKDVDTSATIAKAAAKGSASIQSALNAIEGGAITGAGANMKLDIAKLFHGMGLVDKGNLIQNTEVFRGTIQPLVAALVKETSGTTQLSDNELRFAERAAAGDIRLEARSIKELMRIIDIRQKEIITNHQQKLDVLFGDNAQAKSVWGVQTPKVHPDIEARQWARDNPNDPRAAAIRQRLGMQ